MEAIAIEPAEVKDQESDVSIDVSPFLELTSEYGSPIWVRKSSVIAVKGGNRIPSFRSSIESRSPASTIFTAAGEISVAHDALEIMESLGNWEL